MVSIGVGGGVSLGLRRHRPGGGVSGPVADSGYVLLVDDDGAYLTDDDGAYLEELV